MGDMVEDLSMILDSFNMKVSWADTRYDSLSGH